MQYALCVTNNNIYLIIYIFIEISLVLFQDYIMDNKLEFAILFMHFITIDDFKKSLRYRIKMKLEKRENSNRKRSLNRKVIHTIYTW